MALCTKDCPAYDNWPVNPLPPKPIEWPIERRLKAEASAATRDLTQLKDMFASFVQPLPEGYDMWAHISVAMHEFMRVGMGKEAAPLTAEEELQLAAFPDSCDRHNITCKIIALCDHKPLQDHDGDRFSTKESRRLRGSDWRGYDCNDKRDDVYPGRKTYPLDFEKFQDLDHNCNGISGGNSSGLYEDMFCANSSPRGLVILGDSATAHFHIPPQWITADGW